MRSGFSRVQADFFRVFSRVEPLDPVLLLLALVVDLGEEAALGSVSLSPLVGNEP